MSKPVLIIDKLITIDDTGMPKAPNVRQLLDKDVRELYTRDKTPDKRQYIAECGVIYYLGDPKSPAKQKGLSDSECIREAISNFNLPKNYTPDILVLKLAKRYYNENITEAGVAVEILQQAIHNIATSIKVLNQHLNEKMANATSLEDVQAVIGIIDSLNKKTAEIPTLSKKLEEAKQNLMYETQTLTSRGGKTVSSSMDADEYNDD